MTVKYYKPKDFQLRSVKYARIIVYIDFFFFINVDCDFYTCKVIERGQPEDNFILESQLICMLEKTAVCEKRPPSGDV